MEDIISILSNYAFVKSYAILKFERTQTTRRLRISVDLVDGSELTISQSTVPRGFRYAYHWQDANKNLLARWDNAPHHPQLHTFPDHFHKGTRIEPAVQPSIREVLEYISKQLT